MAPVRAAVLEAARRDDVVLKRSSLEEMFRPQIAGPEPGVSLGLGYFLERRDGLDLIGHSGEQNGFMSHFFVHPASRAAFIVAYNTNASSQANPDRPNTRRLDDAIRDHFAQRVFPALAASSSTAAR
ncbi:MAG: hypothetical protein GEV06_07140 [Luteitalea sp.]|nr:hypothetical protein [Luteitalea sp.]